jgi:hypothetical protein
MQIRPLEPGDLPTVAALYADFDGWPPAGLPVLEGFFQRVLVDHPFADPELPTLVCEDARIGVAGVICSHARRFVHGDRVVRVRACGPLIVHRDIRRRGVGLQLLEHLLDGPQDLSTNDRAIDQMRRLWERAGGVVDTAASVGWSHVIAPVRFLAGAAARRLGGREEPPAAALLARLDARISGRLHVAPPGSVEPLADETLLTLLPQVATAFPLRPAYEPAYLGWLFGEMARADVAERLVRRLVRDADGRPAGWYVAYVSTHGLAHVMQIAGARQDMPLVLGQLVRDAAAHGAVEVRGRVEPHLLPSLRELRCRFIPIESTLLHARDRSLLDAVLFGHALVTRMDGEWWMRPSPGAASA